MKKSILSRVAVASSLVLALSGCDKLKSLAGGGSAEGGAAASSSGLSLSGLEGEIDIAATAKKAGQPDKTINVAMMIKGSKMRADMPTGIEGMEKMGKIYGIMDSDAKKAFIVLDQQKEVIEIDLNQTGEQLKSFKPPSHTSGGTSAPPSNPPKITKTGKTDTVAGYSCEIWEIQNTEPGDKSKADVCVAQQGISFFHIPLTGAPAEYAALGELMDGSHFPLRGVGFDKDGTTEAGRVEVTKIDKKTLDPNLFVPPPTYKVIDIATAVQGFMGGGAGGAGLGGAGDHGLPPGFQGGHIPPHGALPGHH